MAEEVNTTVDKNENKSVKKKNNSSKITIIEVNNGENEEAKSNNSKDMKNNDDNIEVAQSSDINKETKHNIHTENVKPHASSQDDTGISESGKLSFCIVVRDCYIQRNRFVTQLLGFYLLYYIGYEISLI